MTRPNNQIIITLSMIFIGMFLCPKPGLGEEAAVKEESKETTGEPNKVEYKSEKLRDPFQREEIQIKKEAKEPVASKPLPSLRVQGVVWGGPVTQAIINNKVVKVGDTIGEVNIIEINKAGVTVLFENQRYNLTTSPQQDAKAPVSPDKSKGVKNNTKGGKHE